MFFFLKSADNVIRDYRRVPDIRSNIVNLDRYHTTNRPATRANENGPATGGCLISSMVTVNIHGQHLYRELNS